MQIVDEEGERALTVRRAASDLGISTRTLYKRIRTREDLLRVVGDDYARTLTPPVRHNGQWNRTVWKWCADLHRRSISHPRLTDLLGDRISAALSDEAEDLVNLAVNGGVTRKRAGDCIRIVVTVTVNSALADARSATRDVPHGQSSAWSKASSRGWSDAVESILNNLATYGARELDDAPEPVSTRFNGARKLEAEMKCRPAESTLAWLLADSARPLLNDEARSWLCAQIGAGDHRGTIEELLVVMSKHSVGPPDDIEKQVLSWLSGYAGSDGEERLRRPVDEALRVPRCVRESPLS